MRPGTTRHGTPRWLATLLLAAVAAPSPGAGQDAAEAAVADTLTLDEAIASALATHPLLDRASAASDIAEADIGSARADWFPSLSLSGTTVRFAEPMVVAPLHAFDPTMPPVFDRTLIQGRAEASYRVFDGGARGARVEAARWASDAAGAEARSAREDVLAGVTIAYARAAAASIRHEAAREREAAGVEGKRQADRLLEQGAVAEVETVRAEAERLAGVAAVATAASFEAVARQDLARWMGVEPAALADRPLRAMGVDPEAIRGDAVPSAEVERAAHRVRQAEASVDIERAGRLPNLDAQAALLEFGSGEGSFQGEWQAGLALSFPAFTGGARSAAIDRARATARGAAAELEIARLRQASAIDRERASLVAAIANAAALRERSEALFEVMDIAFLAYEQGAGTQRERTDASADAYEARAALADAVAEQVRAAVELGRALGVLTPDWISRALGPTP